MDSNFLVQNSIWFGVALASGSMLAFSYWRERGLTEILGTVAATQLINRENAQIIDVRPAQTYANGHIAQAKHIEITELADQLSSLRSQRPLLVIGSEREASRALKLLKAKGLRAYALAGGYHAWQQAGLPVEKSA